ncbi:MAG: right-handed parallel beta-helix repeat-containing protein, partial [Candidatus Omnitrophica bacterium]|nr:right-handed parallel beta-helix repeat-containing protein [Candidatus Omnitrophota bacterium]
MKRHYLAASIFLVLGTSLPIDSAHAATLYVKQGSSGSGTSWNDAFGNPNDALAAAIAGDEIWVASGTYTPGSQRTDSFYLKDEVEIYGGFAGAETSRDQRDPEVNETILSGELGDPSSVVDNTNNIVWVLSNVEAHLDGFTITRGNARTGEKYGGGILVQGGSIKARNLKIIDNRADNEGGGVELEIASGSLFENCLFTQNFSQSVGGGLTITGDSSDISIVDCDFIDNEAAKRGGGVSGFGPRNVYFVGCLFQGNRAEEGGGLYFSYTNGQTSPKNVEFINTRIIENEATQEGGGVFFDFYWDEVLMKNCVVARNTSSMWSGVALVAPEANSRAIIENCSIFDNSNEGLPNAENHGIYATSGASFPLDVIVRDSIVWGNGNE